MLCQAFRLNPAAGYLYFLLLGRAYFFVADLQQAEHHPTTETIRLQTANATPSGRIQQASRLLFNRGGTPALGVHRAPAGAGPAIHEANGSIEMRATQRSILGRGIDSAWFIELLADLAWSG
jgi:hypothetical protein